MQVETPVGARHVLRVRTVLPLERLHEYGREKTVARTFSMHTTVDRPSLLARARVAAEDNGATFVGGEQSGRFSHEMAKGAYRMAGQTVTVTITNKHWLLPWPVVEARLKEMVR